MTIAIALLAIACGIALALYVTWLFVERLKRGEPKGRSFREWLKHLSEVVWGI